MSRGKTERLLNLVMCLVSTRRFLSKEQIRQAVPGYPQGPEAFARAFERDKDELRTMGIPIETGINSALFDDEVGYRIEQDAYALPPVALTPHEWTVLELASRTWNSSPLAASARRGMLKLSAELGSDTAQLEDPQQQEDPWWQQQLATTTAAADAQVLAVLAQCMADRQALSFSYRKAHAAHVQQRYVQPWGVVARRGRWYLVGFDTARQQKRVFRLDRFQAPPTPVGPEHAFTVAQQVDLTAEVAQVAPPSLQGHARLALAPTAGASLRRYATSVRLGVIKAPDKAVGCDEQQWDEVRVDYHDLVELAGQVAALAGQAVVLEPLALKDHVVRHLQTLLQIHSHQSPQHEQSVPLVIDVRQPTRVDSAGLPAFAAQMVQT